jgi:amidophosphoribosyltransferase
MTVDEICRYVGADSLAYLSLDGMMDAIGSKEGYCNACFTGSYPLPLSDGMTKTGFEQSIG